MEEEESFDEKIKRKPQKIHILTNHSRQLLDLHIFVCLFTQRNGKHFAEFKFADDLSGYLCVCAPVPCQKTI